MVSHEVPVLPPAVPGDGFDLDDPRSGRIHGYEALPTPHSDRAPLLLVHSVNAAASAFEVRPIFERYAGTRPTYAFDLPGFGLSDRSDRAYSPRLMTDALLAVAREIRRRRGDAPIDALALSLSSEFLARAATEEPRLFRTLAFVSPTGFDGTRERAGPSGSTRSVPGLYGVLSFGLWDDALFRLLTKPGTIRYFLRRTWGRDEIDEGLWAYDVLTTKQPGAKHAPLHFVSGHLFSGDVDRLYGALRMPVWMCHGVRGDFVDYRRAEAMPSRGNWQRKVFETGALPHFEAPGPFFDAYDAFLDASRSGA